MTTRKQYDYLNRLLSISSLPSASGETPASYAYQYNDANQRTRVTMADGSYWVYDYDTLGQLISGKHYWSDGTPIAGQQHEYAYDDIGNRTQTKQGGDSVGAALRAASYSANNLNQYTSRDIPGAADIIGIAHASASVTVNDASPYRKGEYYWKELSINNASAPIWQSVTNIASLSGTNQTNTGNILLSKTAQTFSYDADGNQTNDLLWAYTWDAENRLKQIESMASVPAAAKKKVVFTYDHQGRRLKREEFDWDTLLSTWKITPTTSVTYASDGWQCLADLDALNASTLLRSYLWGLDLSGNRTGAGGVGGLLAVNSAGNGVHFCAMDGNGNVGALVKATDGMVSAFYEYEPFGKAIRANGTMAKENPFRFSTKRADDAADFALYEYRPYSSSQGRWSSRDPLEEQADANLYIFVRNDAVGDIDPDGRHCFPQHIDTPNYNPKSENQPCCCGVADVTVTPRDNGSTAGTFRMALDIVCRKGCWREREIFWETCIRPTGEFGRVPSCDNKATCSFPGTLGGSYAIEIIFRYLTCKDDKWARERAVVVTLNCRAVSRPWWPDLWICD